MKLKTILTLTYILICLTSFGQNEETIFYDKNWKVCNENKAEYYRKVTIDVNGNPTGIVKDYYKTGEIQWEGKMKYIDKYDNSKDISEGLCTWYHKNGQKSRQSTMYNDKEDGITTFWYENGNKSAEREYKLGVLNGKYENYYENNKLKFRAEYKNGKLVDKWALDCDEFEKCQKLFYDFFTTGEDDYGWDPADKDDYKSEIIAKEGMLMQTKTDNGYAQWIHLPINIANNFSIETIINFKGGDKNNAHGLIYGFKDWNNYYYFYISANGFYKIGARTDGINLEYSKWTQSKYINQNNSRNLIKINKENDKVYFSINGQIISSEDFYPFKGNNIGFSIQSGKKEILFERLVVRQDISENESISKNTSNSNWLGNGTGFFIDQRGYIATNYHVVDKASIIEIDLIQNGHKKSYSAKVISSDKQNDLSIIKIDDPKFTSYPKLPYNLKFQICDVGSNVFALGYPMALSIMGEEVKFTDGKISSKTGFQGDITTYQISVPIQPGNSGGPLFDYDGNIVGITNAGIRSAENVAYAIKSSYLKNLIDVLPENLNIPNDQTISTKTLTEKIKLLSDYVVLIKIK